MARTSPDIKVQEFYSNELNKTQTARAAPVIFAIDVAEMIKHMIEQGRLEIKDGQIVPKGKQS